jgi:trimeric autotransporter adhesin
MKRKFIVLSLCFLMVALIVLASCAKSNTTSAQTTSVSGSEPTLKDITLNPRFPPNLGVGNTLRFSAFATYSDGSMLDITQKVTWNSSNTSIATVSSAGLVTCLATGDSKITCTLSGITSQAETVTVR